MTPVILTLSVIMHTDRHPWEMAEALAGLLEGMLKDENPDQAEDIAVRVDNAEEQ